MFTLKQTAIAWAAIALATASAAAGDDVSELLSGAKRTRSVQYSSTGRRISVWRNVSSQEPGSSDQENPFDAPDYADSSEGRPNEPLQQSSPTQDFCNTCGDCTCDGCGTCDACCGCSFCPRSYIFGEYLYLQPVGADMAHAIQQNGVGGPGTTPDGRVGVLNPQFAPAYRVGFGKAIGGCATIGAAYTNFHSHTTDTLSAPNDPFTEVGGTVSSLVLHPNSVNAGSTSSLVDATYDIDFQLADIEYRRLVAANCTGAGYFTAGARYAKLQQQFSQIGNFSPPTGTIETTTNIIFEGAGFRTGLDGERRIGGSRFSAYGKGFLSLMFGEFKSDYRQLNTTTTIVQAASNWQDNRVVPILEYEVGFHWTSFSGRWQATAGYYSAFWFNTISTGDFVRAVQTSDFLNLGQTIAFNGLVTRLEFRF